MTRSLGVLLALFPFLGACAGPARKAEDYARAQGFEEDLTAGTVFRHRIFRAHMQSVNRGTLHVYIEGDGLPFATPTRVAGDPTPRHPLMLSLMALDPAPSVYLGRPCYFGLQRDGVCAPIYWTLRRFSPEVVDSMRAALLAEAARARATRIELYAHSGGATLAVLLAARVPMVTRVVTLGGNLDIDAWSALHGYSPLEGSLNPARTQPPTAPIEMLHLVGSDDRNTPPSLVERAAESHVGGTVRVIPGFSHRCCWKEIWPQVLSAQAMELGVGPARTQL
jgi:hypothetical protein